MDSVVLAASLQAASISVGQSVALVIAGWIVCRKRMKGGTQTVRDVTQSLVWVFSPCLSVTNLVSTLTLEKLLALWLLPVFSCEPASAAPPPLIATTTTAHSPPPTAGADIIAFLGMGVGAVISSVFDPKGYYRPVVIASCACGNGFSLPLSMAGALVLSVEWIRTDPLNERLYTYIFLYVITAGTIMFGPIYYVMGVPRKPLPDTRRAAGPGGKRGGEGEEEGEDDEAQSLLESGERDSIYKEPPPAAAAAAKSLGCVAFARKIINPMLIWSWSGVLMACIAPVREALVGTVLFDQLMAVGVVSETAWFWP